MTKEKIIKCNKADDLFKEIFNSKIKNFDNFDNCKKRAEIFYHILKHQKLDPKIIKYSTEEKHLVGRFKHSSGYKFRIYYVVLLDGFIYDANLFEKVPLGEYSKNLIQIHPYKILKKEVNPTYLFEELNSYVTSRGFSEKFKLEFSKLSNKIHFYQMES